MADFNGLSLELNLLLFALSGLLVVIGGIATKGLADILTDCTDFGEALVGGVLLPCQVP